MRGKDSLDFDRLAHGAPTIVSYCATFLQPEMLHVYRQVTGVERYRNLVVTRRRSGAEQFPYQPLAVLKKSRARFLHRTLHRVLRSHRVPLQRSEVNQLLALGRKHKARLVHIYFGTEAARMSDYLRRETRPVLVSFHGADVSAALSSAEFRLLLGHTAHFMCRSLSLRDALIARGCPPDWISLNPTGIPLPVWQGPRQPPGPGESWKLIQVCRFIEKKGLDLSIMTLKELLDAGQRATLTLVGDGPIKADLRRLVENLALSSHVQFTSFLPPEEVAHQLNKHHIFIHPSRMSSQGDREGVPNAMLEAMSHGLPVVATHHGGIPEAVKSGDEGFLADQATPSALAEAVIAIASMKERFATLSQAARTRIEREFSTRKSIEILEQIYGRFATPDD
jgi:colanic acid/amylovoran biosynthesis glycosyltransferase